MQTVRSQEVRDLVTLWLCVEQGKSVQIGGVKTCLFSDIARQGSVDRFAGVRVVPAIVDGRGPDDQDER